MCNLKSIAKQCPLPRADFGLSIRRAMGTAAALFIFAACTVGPDYVRPKTDVPASYKESREWKIAAPKDASIRGAWWEIFGDAQLNGLEEQVDISNQNLMMAEAQFRQALALVEVAKAGYFPTVTAGASFSRSRRSSGSGGTSGSSGSSRSGGNSSTGTGFGGSTGSTSSDFLLPVDFTWELDVWGRVRRTVEASEASAQASAADLESARLSARAALAQAYFQLRELDAQKRLLDETVTAYERFLEITKNRYASGVASRADVLQAETQLKTTRAEAIDVGVQRAQFEHAIAVLIGRPASVFSIPVGTLPHLLPEIPSGLPSELLERRPDIAAAERLTAAANAQIGVAEAAYYPTVTLTASGGFESSHLSNWLSWPSRFWSVGTAIAETVFEGGLRRAQTAEARAAYDANVASYRQTVLTAFQEVEDNLAALRILQEEASAQEEAVEASQQAVDVTLNQYRAGTLSYLNVIVAQTVALNNERTAIDILGRRMTAGVLLIKALGGGWNAAALQSVADAENSNVKHAGKR